MNIILAYSVSIIFTMVSVFIALYYKYELERMFHRNKDMFIFHVFNILIILLTSLAAHGITALFIFPNNLNLIIQFIILIFFIFVIYGIGHFSFKTYKMKNRKYVQSEDGKILIINEKYLRKKNIK